MGLGFWILGAIALCARDRKCCGDVAVADDDCCGRDSAASVLRDSGCDCREQRVDERGNLNDCDRDRDMRHTDGDRTRGSRRTDCGCFNARGNFEPGTNVHNFNNPRNCNPRSTCCCD